MKYLLMVSMFFFLFFPGGNVDKVYNVESITDSFNYTCKINVLKDDKKYFFNNNDDCKNILKVLKNCTACAHDMPAFGVSIDELTKEEMKRGFWIELEFDKKYEFNGMPFDALLIKIEKDIYGFNLIRRNNNKYDGRCFYLSLENSLNDLYDMIVKL